MYHARIQHLVMRQNEARRQAGQLVEESHSSWFGTIDVLQSPTETMAKIQSTTQRICQIHQCQPSDLIQLTILNWSAPCLIASSQQSTQANLMGALINGAGPGSLGLVMTPSHTYGRGKLYKQQELSHKLLVQNNLNIDGAYCLPFKQRMDERDQRPGFSKSTCFTNPSHASKNNDDLTN